MLCIFLYFLLIVLYSSNSSVSFDYKNKTNTFIRSCRGVPDTMYPIQHYVLKFVSDLRQVGVFLCVLQFPPPI